MIRAPPISTLFPYTTLSRSSRHVLEQRLEVDLLLVGPAHGGASGLADDGHDRHMVQLRVVEPVDRKSTRLNSSHLVISYAVFCLKKKKLDACYASFSSE